MSRIGFIGLGIMGKPMLRNLRKGGHTLVVYDIVPALLDAVLGEGVERAESCADVAARSEMVITMLPDGPEVEAGRARRRAESSKAPRRASLWST